MQILMSAAALTRLGDRCRQSAPDAEIVTIDAHGVLKRDGATLLRPEIIWLSRDLHRTPVALSAMTDHALQNPSVRWIQGYMAGLDHPMFRQVMAKGVRVTKSDAHAPAIAEYVMAHALSLLHPIAKQAALQKARAWKNVQFQEIGGMHVVLVGFGAIGREIVRRLQPFGPRITVVRRAHSLNSHAYETRTLVDLPSTLANADLAILACALNEQTRELANGAFFAAMKPEAVLINVARGALIDEAALRAGLDRGQPGFAILDVFDMEPLPPDAWYWDHPRVRVTAHCSNGGDRTTSRGDDLFVENLRRFRLGEGLLNEATPEEVGLP